MRYDFLLLCGLFALPPIAIFALRGDLRRAMGVMAFVSLPFAFTESWFYPEYWRPRFLFDLADRVGFGIEDLLFVAELGAFTGTLYPFTTRRRFVLPDVDPLRARVVRATASIAAMLLTVVLLQIFAVPVIYGTCVAMAALAAAIVAQRRDLLVPTLLGGLLSVAVYTLLCLLFARLIPGIFALSWNTEKLSNVFVLGVPLEELLYGFAAGLIGTPAYPFLVNARFLSLTTPAGRASQHGAARARRP